MSCQEIISALSDIAVGGAAVAAAYIAWRGLTTWQDQLKGTVEYELARRLLRGAYKLREAIAVVRDSFMSTAEMPAPPPEKAEGMNREQLRHYGLVQAYQLRWNHVLEARRELDPDLLESEVHWGQDLKGMVRPIEALQNELFVAIRGYLEVSDPDIPEQRRIARENAARQRRDVMYSSIDGVDDVFAAELNQAIQAVENYLRPHLKKR